MSTWCLAAESARWEKLILLVKQSSLLCRSMRGEKLDMDAERTARSSGEMKEEAAVFREYFVHA